MVLASLERTLSENMALHAQVLKTQCKLYERTKFFRPKCPLGPFKAVCSVCLLQTANTASPQTRVRRISQLVIQFILDISKLEGSTIKNVQALCKSHLIVPLQLGKCFIPPMFVFVPFKSLKKYVYTPGILKWICMNSVVKPAEA